MDLDDALGALPRPYAEALRLRDRGLDADGIAEELDVPVSAVASLLRLADMKLARLLTEGGDDDEQ